MVSFIEEFTIRKDRNLGSQKYVQMKEFIHSAACEEVLIESLSPSPLSAFAFEEAS